MKKLSFALALSLTSVMACTATQDDVGSAEGAATSQGGDQNRPALENEVRFIIRAAGSDKDMCVVREADGKMKAHNCQVGGEVNPDPNWSCELGGDGCFRVAKEEAWRAFLSRPEEDGPDASRVFTDLVHLDATHLSAEPNPEKPEASTINATDVQRSSWLFWDAENDTYMMPRDGAVSGMLLTVASGSSKTNPPVPASEWCITLQPGAEHPADMVLGLAKVGNMGWDYKTQQDYPKDYSACATITLEKARQVWGPLPETADVDQKDEEAAPPSGGKDAPTLE